MRKIRPLAGILLFILLLGCPGAAADGARAAMAQWYRDVAPSLLPFLALMPLLTCPEAMSAYEALLGGVARRAFGLPGCAAPAMAVAMLAGSPAGSLAVRRVAGSGAMTRAQVKRLALVCCGLSPGFLVTGVGASMLGSAAMGRVLLRSQIVAQLSMLALLRWFLPEDDRRVDLPDLSTGDGQPMAGAVLAVLTVGGWMALFGALGGVAEQLAGPGAGLALRCVLEAGGGARAVAGLGFDAARKLALLSGVLGMSGLCVALQCLSALKGCGVGPVAFMGTRLAAGAMCAGLTLAQMRMGWVPAPRLMPEGFRLSSLGLCVLALPVLAWLWRASENTWKRTED